jgi:hypothetical protein
VFVTRLHRSRRHVTLRPPVAEYVAGAAAPAIEERASLEAGFRTRVTRSRQFLRIISHPPVDPQPVDVPYPAYLPPQAFHSRFRAKLLVVPVLDERPASPPPVVDAGALLQPSVYRRKSAIGLFLAPEAPVEADVVQPLPATFFSGPILPRGRRRRSKVYLRTAPEIDFVEKVPPAGEESVVAWQRPVSLYRRDAKRYLRELAPYPSYWDQSPAWKEPVKLFAKSTGFYRRDVFLSPDPQAIPAPGEQIVVAWQQPKVLFRKDISRILRRLADYPGPLAADAVIDDSGSTVGIRERELRRWIEDEDEIILTLIMAFLEMEDGP